MGEAIRCRWCGEWVDVANGLRISVELREHGYRPKRQIIALHHGACLDAWAPTSGSLLRSMTKELVR